MQVEHGHDLVLGWQAEGETQHEHGLGLGWQAEWGDLDAWQALYFCSET